MSGVPTTLPVIGIDTSIRFSFSIHSKAKTFMPRGLPRGRTTMLRPVLLRYLSIRSKNLFYKKVTKQ